jgi:tRNA(Ile)-lysidine synthase
MPLDPAVAAVRLAVRRELAGPLATVLVACSGGADSLALLAAAVVEGRRAGRRVVGVTVDHGLQEGSQDHADRVVAQMAALGVDETVGVRVRVDSRGQGPEAAAREARYAVLEEVAERFGDARVLLGHTLDDQAETVLLGLARGSGGRSLAGMRPGFGPFRRPLLDLTRAQTEAACRAQGISWWSDPHNEDPRFLRARVRHRVLPVLEAELGPGVAQALARTALQCRWDADALDAIADRALEGARVEGPPEQGCRVGPLAALDRAVLSRVLRRAALEAGAPASDLTWGHVRAISDLVVGAAGDQVGRQVQLPGHVTAYRDGDWLRFRRTAVPG